MDKISSSSMVTPLGKQSECTARGGLTVLLGGGVGGGGGRAT